MYCVATRNRHHHVNYTHPLQQLHLFKVVIQIKIRQHQGLMGDPLQKFHAIDTKRRDIMREISHHQRPTTAL